MDECDEFLLSQVAAVSAERDASGADENTVPVASRHSTYSTSGLNPINLFHGADSGVSFREASGEQLPSTSSEQPVGEEEASPYPRAEESSGLSLGRFGISGTALTLITEDSTLLGPLVTSDYGEVDEVSRQVL